MRKILRFALWMLPVICGAASPGTWALTGLMSEARAAHSATLLLSGQVLVAGGYNYGTNITYSSAELYDSSSGTWSYNRTLRNGFHGVALTNG
jgi:Galactose oxidase, central domain